MVEQSNLGLGEDFRKETSWWDDFWNPNEYQNQLNQYNMMREDSAYQRKVRDLKLAGLNPILASDGSGSSATLGNAVQSGAIGSVVDKSLMAMQKAMNLIQFKKQMKLMDSQISSVLAGVNKTEADTAQTEALTSQIVKGQNLNYKNSIVGSLFSGLVDLKNNYRDTIKNLGEKTYQYNRKMNESFERRYK